MNPIQKECLYCFTENTIEVKCKDTGVEELPPPPLDISAKPDHSRGNTSQHLLLLTFELVTSKSLS